MKKEIVKDIEKTEKRINNFYDRFSLLTKLILLVILVLSVLVNTVLWTSNLATKRKLKKAKAQHEADMQRTTEQYQILSKENEKLKNQKQALNLRLIDAAQNRVELEQLINQLNEENITLYAIKDELSRGVVRSNSQLRQLEASLNTLIDQKQELIDRRERELLKRK